MGDSYKDQLNVSNDIITTDGLSDSKAYKLLNKVFLYVSQAMVSLEANDCPPELQNERNELFRNIMFINETQKQSAQKGFYAQSNKLLTEFLLLLLKHYKKFESMQTIGENMHL